MAANTFEVSEESLRMVMESAVVGKLQGLCCDVRKEVREELQRFIVEFTARAEAKDRSRAQGLPDARKPSKPHLTEAGSRAQTAFQDLLVPPTSRGDPRSATGTEFPLGRAGSMSSWNEEEPWLPHHIRRFEPEKPFAHDDGDGGGTSSANVAALTPSAPQSEAGCSPKVAMGARSATVERGWASVVSSNSAHSQRDKHAWYCVADAECQRRVIRLVKSTAFDYAISVLILVNALTIGAQTNYAAENLTAEVPIEYATLENLFCAIFTGELMLQLYAFRLSFFYRPGWKWNIFDFVVVTLQLLEVIFGGLPNLSFVRMVRILRLVRAIRLIRVVRHISELRTLVASIGNSLAPLSWTLVLLMLLIYTVSLFITQLISDHRLANQTDEENGVFHDLDYYYGSLYRSMLSFFQAIAGGVDWDSLVSPLTDHISVVLAPFFCFYVAFTLLAMMNVLTAVFVESVLESTKNDKDVFMVNNVRELFQGVDGGIHDGIMDWQTFRQKLDTRPMFEFFKAIDVDLSEAAGLFHLLDFDRDGSIDAEEFLSGCLRLRGPARALDLALLIEQVRRIDQQIASYH